MDDTHTAVNRWREYVDSYMTAPHGIGMVIIRVAVPNDDDKNENDSHRHPQ